MTIIRLGGSLNRPQGGVDQSPLPEHRKLIASIERRAFLRGTVSLGALTLLSGCDISNESALQSVLRAMSAWNDRVQAFIFNRHKLARTYSDADVMRPPRFNAFYAIDRVKPVDGATWKLELAGLIENKKPWTKDELYALPRETQITQLVCVEGWDYIGKWSGVPLRTFFDRIGADKTAKYVAFRCADKYWGSIDMATALHPQTILATHYAGQPIGDAYGFPMRLRTPLKLGFKQPKWIYAIEVTNAYPGGYWEDGGYNWFSGV
jgi:DMSO/TMAO reductase YedYZ molybdopterin-dependent catalytic subunit